MWLSEVAAVHTLCFGVIPVNDCEGHTGNTRFPLDQQLLTKGGCGTPGSRECRVHCRSPLRTRTRQCKRLRDSRLTGGFLEIRSGLYICYFIEDQKCFFSNQQMKMLMFRSDESETNVVVNSNWVIKTASILSLWFLKDYCKWPVSAGVVKMVVLLLSEQFADFVILGWQSWQWVATCNIRSFIARSIWISLLIFLSLTLCSLPLGNSNKNVFTV